MKRISDLLKPFLSIIFGALLFLCHFNWLMAEGGYLALGIIAVIFAAYFITVGLLGTLFGEKFPQKTRSMLETIGIALYPLFFAVLFLVSIIVNVKADLPLGPLGWSVSIFTIISGLGLGGLLLLAYFFKSRTVTKLAFLFASLFVLALLLNILLDGEGDPATLGSIVLLYVALYGVYLAMLIGSLNLMKEQLKAPKEVKKEEEK